jgi:replicative DNA helicase
MTVHIDTDYATIGGLLLDPGQVDEISRWLRPSDFTRPLCGELFELIAAMRGDGKPVDPVTVLGELQRRGRIRTDGYPTAELIAMVESVPAPVMTPHYARQVLEGAVFRRVEQVGTRIVQVGRGRRGGPEGAFAALTGCMAELAEVRDRWRLSVDSGRPAPTALRASVRDRSVRSVGRALG